ncbi:hypothetical protein BJ684DRAFT_9611 [Piptocephalis cylindrospora]|uniref:Uncharacterized protein n=1 Tax=Piptocephalis cylindrospora TaxID=1907219 RepID=A0A4P9Y472_9FUNG|nr:hypothetical protein BJ684DRAFT_9611 [Piptocephalis cylindrospora]|eukprot:RKP13756.1 hypothetical protein BJ684DRAFT_9611 [Piptocephalis cylindrospora]
MSEYDRSLTAIAARRRRSRQSSARRQSFQSVQIEENKCWICMGTDRDTQLSWLRACGCSLRAHESCLLRWIDESYRSKASSRVPVVCPQCRHPYKLRNSSAPLLSLLGIGDGMIQRIVPYVTFLGLSASFLITTTTYGVHAIITMCGPELGDSILNTPQPWGWRIWVGLPSIPIGLIMSRGRQFDPLFLLLPSLLIRPTLFLNPRSLRPIITPSIVFSLFPWVRLGYLSWYDGLIRPIEHRWDLQLASSPLSLANEGERANQAQAGGAMETATAAVGDRADLARTVVGALLLPSISSAVGSLLSRYSWFSSRISTPLYKNLLGGCLFILAKDAVRLLYKYQRLSQRKTRRIVEYQG